MAVENKMDCEMMKKILSDINMTQKDLEEAVLMMKQWLTKRRHLPPAASDDALLKSFIIGCKSVERAKVKLDKYFTYRLLHKDYLYPNRDPLQIAWNKAATKCMTLPGLTPEGYMVCLITLPDKSEIREFEMKETTKVFFMEADCQFKENFMPSGYCFVFDMSNISAEVLLKFSIPIISTSIKVFLDGYPHRIKNILSFNSPTLTQTFFSTFITPFLSAKLKQRVIIHSEDHRCLEKYFPLEMLPSDYEGGKNPSIKTLLGDMRQRLESYRDWFLTEGSETSNEDLRPQEEKDEMMGTFRKLQID